MNRNSLTINQKENIENVLGCGIYQVFIFVIYQLVIYVQAANAAYMSFGKVAPIRWSCGDGNFSKMLSEVDKCKLLANGSCQGIEWETDFFSLVPEWQLVCNRTGIVYLIMFAQMFGILIGSPIFGQFSDRYGRKWTLWFAHTLTVVLDGFCMLSPNWQAFITLRFFIGLTCGGTITVGYVYLNEVIKAKHRLWVNAIGGWPPGFAVLAILAYITRDWKKLLLSMVILGIPPILMIPFTAESPRWQLQNKKLNAAKRSAEHVLKWNRADLTDRERLTDLVSAHQNFSVSPRTERQNTRKYMFWHLCMTKKMTVDMVVLMFANLSIGVITYGIVLNNDKLSGNMYLNFLLLACIRWVSGILSLVADASIKCCGRKLMSAIPFAIICIAASAIFLIIIFASKTSTTGLAITGLVLAAFACTSPIWVSLNLTSVEAFPTAIRNTAVGVNAVFIRIGAVVVPLFLFMAELWKPSPYVLFAILTFISAILCGFRLPETKGKPLPDKMPQSDPNWLRCCKSKKNTRNGESTNLYQLTPDPEL